MRYKLTYLFILSLGLTVSNLSDLMSQISTISIHTDETILDEPKVPGTFIYIGFDGNIISSNIGIEIRGGFSQSFSKKTYDIEFWNDPSGEETIDVQFGDLREDDDWVLDAMFNEPLRINSYMAHKLWLDMNQLYYQNDEPKAKSGADVMYTKVTINDEYQGIYLLSEQVDRFQMKLKKNINSQIKGELYKGYDSDDAVFFNNPDETPNNNSMTWSGYEYRYPTDVIDWSNVAELVNFVANSTDADFEQEISNRFDIDNLMDYFIFLNLTRMLDNRGKNIYLCRYDVDEPYFLAPWDLDGSWGLLWNGTNDTDTEDILSNRLFNRLIDTNVNGYRQNISDRWNELRNSIISDNELESKINEAHQFLLANDIYALESEVWDYEYSISDLNYMFNWLEDRLDYLDDYFNNITDVEDIGDMGSINIYPNPAFNQITVSGDFDKSSSFRIYNVLGEVKLKNGILSQGNRIDINDLVSGMYVLEIFGLKKVFYKI